MIDTKVREWLMSLPGLYIAKTPQAVLEVAQIDCAKATGLSCSIGEFEAGLWRSGYVAQQAGEHFQLALPEPPVNSYSALAGRRSARDGRGGMT